MNEGGQGTRARPHREQQQPDSILTTAQTVKHLQVDMARITSRLVSIALPQETGATLLVSNQQRVLFHWLLAVSSR